MQYTPSRPRPYKRHGKTYKGRYEIDMRGVFDNGFVVERERRVFPPNDNAGPIGSRQAAAMARELFEQWNRYGQVLRPGETPILASTGGMTTGTAPTVAQFADDYLAFCASPNATRRGANSVSTIENKKDKLRLHLLPAFGSFRLDQIHRRDVDQYIMSKSKSGRSMNTISMDLCVLRQMMTLACDHDLITHVPKFKLPPTKPSEVVSLKPEEAKRFLAAASDRSLRDATLLELYLRTGMRSGEAVALRPCDFDLDAEKPVVTVRWTFSRGRFGKTKGRNVRLVPVESRLAAKIAELFRKRGLSPKSETEFVFGPRNNMRKPLSNRLVHRMVTAVGLQAGLGHVHPHMLRHTFGTDCVRRGVPPVTLKEWMGHRKIETTMAYVHLVAPDHLRWAKLLAD